jgi:hypothetical protein
MRSWRVGRAGGSIVSSTSRMAVIAWAGRRIIGRLDLTYERKKGLCGSLNGRLKSQQTPSDFSRSEFGLKNRGMKS